MSLLKSINCQLTDLKRKLEFPIDSADAMKSIMKEKYFDTKEVKDQLPPIFAEILEDSKYYILL